MLAGVDPYPASPWVTQVQLLPTYPPTGQSVAYTEIFIMRFVNGRIAEVWGVTDIFSQVKQLGMIQA